MPYFISLTHDVDLVMQSSPMDMYWYRKADEFAMKKQDEMNWLAGMYTASAVGSVVSGALGKAKDYVKAPILSKGDNEERGESQATCEKFKAQYEFVAMDLRKQGLPETIVDLTLVGD